MTRIDPAELARLVETLGTLAPEPDVPGDVSVALRDASAAITGLVAQVAQDKADYRELNLSYGEKCESLDQAEARLREIAEERDELRCALEVHRTMRGEVYHAMTAGPEWYTKGESGLRGQVRMWLTYADEAYATLTQAKP